MKSFNAHRGGRPRTDRPNWSVELLEDRLAPATLFVSPAGQDAAGRGFAPDAPVRSLQFAANVAAGGDQIRVAEHILIFPSIALSVTILSFLMLGDAVRDALDPKLR